MTRARGFPSYHGLLRDPKADLLIWSLVTSTNNKKLVKPFFRHNWPHSADHT